MLLFAKKAKIQVTVKFSNVIYNAVSKIKNILYSLKVYRRLVTAVNEIEKRLPFSHNDRFGFLTFCPTNLGTTVRASVHIKVPKLAANKAKLEEVAAKYNLQVRGTRGEHTEAEGGIYDISNKRRLGLTEYQAVKEMNDGIAELIKLEASL